MKMAKQIEIISGGNPLTLKAKLETMVNDGWEIKGIYNSADIKQESYVILQRERDESITPGNIDLSDEMYYSSKEPEKKDISISMG